MVKLETIIKDAQKDIHKYRHVSTEEILAESNKYRNKWSNKYFRLPFKWYFLNPIISIPLKFKWFIQRRIRGFDDREVWDLSDYLKKWIAPRLTKYIKEEPDGHPNGVSYKKWIIYT